MRKRSALCSVVLFLCVTAALAFAQDAVKVDPAHYKVESENAQVRVLRVHYGPHEKSVLHSHPASVVVYLTDGTIKFTDAEGKSDYAEGAIYRATSGSWVFSTGTHHWNWGLDKSGVTDPRIQRATANVLKRFIES